ncbi:MAG: hypothetical protein EOO50_01910 [Flavobacterium sp.]|uniref:iron chaperone n=1 Tax=Flavobacterium sp. TaxID=239 RepID=UPI00120A1010|nr:DUF1801 domain-containing protein [Flavobacterium sp.]RZJ68197.1 MAG: hypothetical protein EOO50_01910 [Flavobacterium sp.]
MNASEFKNIDEYIEGFPSDVRKILAQVRQAVHEAAPKAKEKISYKMPAFELHGNLVYFAAFKNHIGFYALPSGNAEFQKELAKYKTGKGSIQFPIGEPMPVELIKKIVKYRVVENMAKAEKKSK